MLDRLRLTHRLDRETQIAIISTSRSVTEVAATIRKTTVRILQIHTEPFCESIRLAITQPMVSTALWLTTLSLPMATATRSPKYTLTVCETHSDLDGIQPTVICTSRTSGRVLSKKSISLKTVATSAGINVRVLLEQHRLGLSIPLPTTLTVDLSPTKLPAEASQSQSATSFAAG